MMKKSTFAFCLLLTGCYSGWEYVRLEKQVPDSSCVYKMQEACSQNANQCLNWHKKRATTFDANTVVITDAENHDSYVTSIWSGRSKGGENKSTVAEYYYCNTPKNLKP